MVDMFGRWTPDFPGQMAFQDPMYIRSLSQAQQAAMQQAPQNNPTPPQSPGIMWEFIHVQNEDVARNDYVPPGTTKRYIDGSAPYIYIKTASNSPMEPPKFERYLLVKKDAVPAQAPPAAAEGQTPPGVNLDAYALKADVDALRTELALFRSQFAVPDPASSMMPGGAENG